MRKPREYRWYVRPLDSHTNEVIWGCLQKEERIQYSMPVKDCHSPNLWECTSEELAMLRNSRADKNLRFWVYAQEGQGTPRRAAIFDKPKRRIIHSSPPA